MKKKQREASKSFEIVLVCDRCGKERNVAVVQADITKSPHSCPRCGCQQWTQKK